MCTRLSGNLEGNRQLGAPTHTSGGGGTLKRERYGLSFWTKMSCLKWGAVASCCDHGNESLCPIKEAGFRE